MLVELSDEDERVMIGIDVIECGVKEMKGMWLVFVMPIGTNEVGREGMEEDGEGRRDERNCDGDE